MRILLLIVFLGCICVPALAQQDDRCKREGALAMLAFQLKETGVTREEWLQETAVQEDYQVLSRPGSPEGTAALVRAVGSDVYNNPEIGQFSHYIYRVSTCVFARAGKDVPSALAEVIVDVNACQVRFGKAQSNPLALCIARVFENYRPSQ